MELPYFRGKRGVEEAGSQIVAVMRPLGIWLIVLGLLRLWSVWFSFFDSCTLRLAFFPDMTDVHGRTFGTWTLLTCTLLFMTGSNLQNKPLYVATFLSFIYTLVHFLSEYFIYKSMPFCGLVTTGFFAGVSIVWMSLEWDKADKPKSVKQL